MVARNDANQRKTNSSMWSPLTVRCGVRSRLALYQYETRPISSNVTIAVAVSQGMSLRSNGVMAANRVVGHPLSGQGAYQTTLV